MNDRSDPDGAPLLRHLADRVSSMRAYWDRTLLCRYANRACEDGFAIGPGGLLGSTMPEPLAPSCLH